MAIVGWDVGGVNTKCAAVVGGQVVKALSRPYEIRHNPDQLVPLLCELAGQLPIDGPRTHAVTMTAELSRVFRTKRDGVAFVLDALATAFPSETMLVYTVDGRFVLREEALTAPIAVAAANWAATAAMVARRHGDALLVDIGTTTTDIIPIVNGSPRPCGLTDPERLASGELVYTGAIRTPIEALLRHAPFRDGLAGVSAEGFALIGDAHVWRGTLSADEYVSCTPDGRPPTRVFAGERLARVICGDRELLDDGAISAIADAAARAQRRAIVAAIERVLNRHPQLHAAVVTGLGAFIAEEAATAAGLSVIRLGADIGEDAARIAPAAAVALLLESALKWGRESLHFRNDSRPHPVVSRFGQQSNGVDTVVKLGGSLLGDPDDLDGVLARIAHDGLTRRIVIVPGGGPFADTVRELDRRVTLDADSAHWMAVLAMDQYAHVIASRLPAARIIANPDDLAQAFADRKLPVLAPFQWLHRVDPLPHSWDVTSDSIAAWIAGALGADELTLIKPAGASGQLVDQYFERALPPSITLRIARADEFRIAREGS